MRACGPLASLTALWSLAPPQGMFRYANSFNKPLDSWQVSRVTNMRVRTNCTFLSHAHTQPDAYTCHRPVCAHVGRSPASPPPALTRATAVDVFLR